jgi:outer membrane protein OmpA-like peptidoglycan-associated protein
MIARRSVVCSAVTATTTGATDERLSWATALMCGRKAGELRDEESTANENGFHARERNFLVLAAGAQCLFAEELDLEQQIVNALKALPITRGLSTSTDHSATDPQQRQLIESLSTTRSLSARECDEVVTVTKNRPPIDLEIFFDFRSAELGQRAMPSPMALGRALTSPEPKGDEFLVAGHTDAKGDDSYNHRLSQRRAAAVICAQVQDLPEGSGDGWLWQGSTEE